MSDEGKRKPPRFPRPTDIERGPETERSGFIPPPPRTPREPFRLLSVDEAPRASWLIPAEFRDQIQKLLAGHNQILVHQRKMAQQLDGYGVVVNERFDVFHRELAMLRALVAKNDERLDGVERTLGQKVVAVGGAVGKGAVYTLLGGLLVKVFPEYAELIGGLLGLLR